MAFAWLNYLSFTLFFLPMTNQEIICLFNSIYQLGDSTSDTGNLIRIPGIGPTIPAARSPYGITFPGQPTGRWSDGRLIMDYIAMKHGLPLLNPYLNQNASFENAVNFAVAGATALNVSFLRARGVTVPDIDATPLSDQLNWFRQYLSSICSNPRGFDRATLLKACCGIGGLYNYDRNRFCGSPRVPVCANPALYISWEGNHLTQEAHRRITENLLPSILLQLRCSR